MNFVWLLLLSIEQMLEKDAISCNFAIRGNEKFATKFLSIWIEVYAENRTIIKGKLDQKDKQSWKVQILCSPPIDPWCQFHWQWSGTLSPQRSPASWDWGDCPRHCEIIPVDWHHISPVKLNLNTWLQYISLPGGVGSPEIEIWDLEEENWKDLRQRRRPKCSLSALMLIRHAQEGWWREDCKLFTKSQGFSLENKKHLPNKHRRGGLLFNLIVEQKLKTSRPRVTLHAQTNFEIRTIFVHSTY